jgi:hypothetical protein
MPVQVEIVGATLGLVTRSRFLKLIFPDSFMMSPDFLCLRFV